MALKYLLGPVSADWAARYWSGPRGRGECVAFNSAGDLDLTVGPGDSWADVEARLPAAWRPDAVVLDLAYASVPARLWSAPVPLVELAADWNLLWHGYRSVLPLCERVLTDAPGVEVMRRCGWTHGRPANLYGPEPALLGLPLDGPERDIDVLFVGNPHPAVQRERLPWLGRLARLAGRWRVAIRAGVFGDDYRDLLRRARVVFNRSVRGECNRRAFEAAACGALLFQERGNAEAEAYFRDRRECVYYDDDLERLLEHYLTFEDQRRAAAAAAHARVQSLGFEALLGEALGRLEAEWPAVRDAVARRPRPEGDAALSARTWQALSRQGPADPTLAGDLEAAAAARPEAGAPHHALGLLAGAAGAGTAADRAREAAGRFRRALGADSQNATAALNLIEALAALGKTDLAAEGARRALDLLDRGGEMGPAALEAGRFPPGFDAFRVEWERAAWSHPGDPAGEGSAKQALLRWRLHALLGELTGDLAHFRAAVWARPDLATTQAALGRALGRSGRHAEAVEPLRRAVRANPFDLRGARALGHALGRSGDAPARDRFLEERRLLSRAAPGLVPPEDWFAGGEARPPKVRAVPPEEFRRRFGSLDTSRAVHSFTPPADAHVVLTLLAHARPRRVLEVGTAAGHMTANLTEWSPDDAVVFTLGTLTDGPAGGGGGPQACETPPRADFGRFAGRFGKADKVFFVTADSLRYDFRRLGGIDFAFIDGAHDLGHVLSDSANAYRQLAPGGWLVWHDYASPAPWVEVTAALERTDFPEPIFHVAGTGVAFLQKQSAPAAGGAGNGVAQGAGGSAAAPALGAGGPPAVVWEGAQASLHSLGLVNRELCKRLLGRGCELSLLPREYPPQAGVPTLPLDPALAGRAGRPLSRPAEVHVRHAWPPDFRPPAEGRWVVVQPWEFGSLPTSWVGPVRDFADEVWAYTRHVRDCYVRSGVPADIVHVVPLGVDSAVFTPGAVPLPLRTSKKFKFLFVGGTIRRKGIDLLLEAYARAFTSEDDVCLVVKDMGAGSFYRGQTAEALIAGLRARPGAPEVEHVDGALSAAEMAGLYVACDCLAQPYRGEGFGLPMVEAMACGLPVVVTGMGAALDYCDDDNAYLLPARVRHFPTRRVGEWETVDLPWLAEPDPDALAACLRRVLARPDEAEAKGAAGRARALGGFTWEHSAGAVMRRLEELRRRPVRRFRRTGGPAAVLPPVAAPRLPAPASAGAGRMRVSLCLIVRDEEENLPACLGSAAGLADEVIVVDTGSTDRTKEVALRSGAKVYDFPWVDDFAAARNESLRRATGDWVFWLDADDRLDEENRGRLKALFAGLGDDNAAYAMKCLCLPDRVTGTATVVDHVRLFRNRPDVRWGYRVHEQILPAVRRAGGEVRWTDVTVRHAGYQDPALRSRKLERDLRLLRLEDADRPDDPFTLFNIGSVYHELGKPAEALPRLRRSLEKSHPRDSIVRKLYALIAGCHRLQNQVPEALAACEEGRHVCPDDAELLFLEGLLRREQGDLAGAEACLRQVLNSKPGPHFASVDAGLRGYKGRHNLAVVFHQQGRAEQAEAQWRLVVAERPDFLPGWLGLGEAALRQADWPLLEEAAARLDGLPQGPLEAAVLRGPGLLARRDFAAARALVEGAAGRFPREVAPRLILTHVLLQEGTDPDAAERALRDVLALAPDHAEARRNLDLLLRQRQRRASDAA